MAVFFIAGSSYYPSQVELPGNGFIELDATVSLGETFSSNVSSHPVQVGSDVTDHVRPENAIFEVKGEVSDYAPTRPSREGAMVSPAGTREGVRPRAKEAYDILQKMRVEVTLFTLVTKYESYPNCIIKRLTVNHSQETGGALKVDITVEQLRLVSTSSVLLAINKASPDESRGTKSNGTSSKGSTETAAVSSLDRVLGTNFFGDAINSVGD